MLTFEEWESATHDADQKAMIDFLMEFGVLKNSALCISCNCSLSLVKYTRNKNGFAWRCMNSKCDAYQKYSRIINKSFFSNFSEKLSFIFKILLLRTTNIAQSSMIDTYPTKEKTIRKVLKKFKELIPIQTFLHTNQVAVAKSCKSINYVEL